MTKLLFLQFLEPFQHYYCQNSVYYLYLSLLHHCQVYLHYQSLIQDLNQDLHPTQVTKSSLAKTRYLHNFITITVRRADTISGQSPDCRTQLNVSLWILPLELPSNKAYLHYTTLLSSQNYTQKIWSLSKPQLLGQIHDVREGSLRYFTHCQKWSHVGGSNASSPRKFLKLSSWEMGFLAF